ncbi:hypothetical protein ACJIZ3_004483 [Penstemon smallii]|uniref:Uncharacterized protein n=1 Tax=Penstemon smallii TaxID=265156 RepID=A0ABD3S2E6_9LAMI
MERRMKQRFSMIGLNPSFTKIVANFNTEDYLRVGVITIGTSVRASFQDFLDELRDVCRQTQGVYL